MGVAQGAAIVEDMQADVALVSPPDDQAPIVAALRRPEAYALADGAVDVVETLSAHVFLAGDHAFKVKKAVRLPFLDFSTLEARRRYCEIELSLNRRTAPSIYLDVVPVTVRDGVVALGGDGEVVEWALRMRRFAQGALLSEAIARGALAAPQVDAFAERVAAFHRSLRERTPPGRFGSAAHALQLATENLDQLEPLLHEPSQRSRLEALRGWTLAEHAAREALMRERLDGGFVRECHGDLHLANVAIVDGEPTPFDCIEFDPALRWSDVMSDVAFAAMDLRVRGRAAFARRFVNRYLESGGDYAGAPLLPFFSVYRALVRAKVAALRAAGSDDAAVASRARAETQRYLDVAEALSRPNARAIVAMHGLSGCGKTSLSQALIEQVDILRIRMDVERKRQHGLHPLARGGTGVDAGLYAPQASREAYERVASLAQTLVDGGQPVVVDAAFLHRWQRDLFRDAATRCAASFTIADLRADAAVLRERVARRSAEGRDASDADLAVLEHQIATAEPPAADEQADVVAFDANRPLAETIASPAWQAWLATLKPRPRRAG